LKKSFRQLLQKPGTTISLSPYEALLPEIEEREDALRELTDEELIEAARALRWPDGEPTAADAEDAEALDSGAEDADAPDSGAEDADALDSGAEDADALDSGAEDAEAPDSGAEDGDADDSAAADAL